MSSTFFGLEIGSRALAASQLALDVVGQNTSNVNTPGYSRQVANFTETDPYSVSNSTTALAGQLGTGVTISSVDRVRDNYLDQRLYQANSDQGALNNLRDILSRVETAYGEPSTTGVGSTITALFSSFSDLSASPESGAIRSTVSNQGQAVASAFHQVDTALSLIAPDLQRQIQSKVDTVNNIAGQIAVLNKQIGQALNGGEHPNDLQDQRGALLSQLSNLVDVQVTDLKNPETGQGHGQISVTVGGYNIVSGDSSYTLPSTVTTANNTFGLQTSSGQTIPLKGGAIFGLVKATTLVQGYRSDLDNLASNLINAVNTAHKAGYGLDGATGRDFFAGTNAATIGVSPTVLSDVNTIAAAAAPTPPNPPAAGNGDTARSIAALNSQPVIGGSSLNEYYNAKVAAVGADSQTFQTESDNQAKVVNQLQSQQSSVSGVNIDEELTKLLQYQRTYQAAARIINVQDTLLATIISGLGAGSAGG